jgi:peptidoglycan-associated lipoprotein
MRTITILSTLASAVVLISACSTAVKVAEKPAPVVVEAPKAPVARTEAVVAVPVADPLNDPANILSKRNVYFDYDNYAIKAEFTSLVQAHAKYLAENGTKKVQIQGNADERGGSEYNLALGQKRAEAVRKAMILSGAAATQLEAISYGKEKPKASGHDEASWAENRRDDIVYVNK